MSRRRASPLGANHRFNPAIIPAFYDCCTGGTHGSGTLHAYSHPASIQEGIHLIKALRSIGLMLLIALASLLAMHVVFAGTSRHADADPNALLAGTLLPFMREGEPFSLADAYPDAWETVQLVSDEDTLTPWVWRALRAFDTNLAEPREGHQLLVFWRDGQIARVIRFARGQNGMPWFVPAAAMGDAAIIPREGAVFIPALFAEGGIPFYQCVQRDTGAQV